MLSSEGELHLLGVFMAVMQGRDPLTHVKRMSGEDCMAGHAVNAEMDQLLKAQWKMTGSPKPGKKEDADAP